MTIAEKLKEEGVEEGKREDQIETAITLLEKKFNKKLNEDLKTKIEKANREQLLKIRNNIFEISSLREVEKILQ